MSEPERPRDLSGMSDTCVHDPMHLLRLSYMATRR